MSYILTDSVRVLDGVGPKIADALAEVDIFTLSDLLHFFPRRYINASSPISFSEAVTDAVAAFAVKVVSVSSGITARRHLKVVTASAEDQHGRKGKLIWYNQPYRAKQLRIGQELIVVGVPTIDRQIVTLVNPRLLNVAEVLPLYRRLNAVPAGTVRKLVQQALLHVRDSLRSGLPQHVVSDEDYAWSVCQLHQPSGETEIRVAKEMLARREGWQYFASLWLRTRQRKVEKGYTIPADAEYLANVVATLPFSLSPSQKRAVWDSALDMASGRVMNRVINGDVGSGKTVVTGLLACLVARAGYRSVLMAPTDILAEQHADKLSQLFKRAGLRVGQWRGGKKEKEAADADLVVGTHALLYEGAPVQNIALRIVDEQHRFGVIQRRELGGTQTHFLSTTATPIPRTLMLSLLSGVDVSKLSGAPARKHERVTFIASTVDEYEHVDEQIRQTAERGEQVYVVLPTITAIDAGEGVFVEQNTLRSAEGEYERLKKKYPYLSISLAHGKQKTHSRSEILQSFARGELQVLVATTVVEVGVDVPNATLMVIFNASRFGIAQLHQLRGRVGRADKPGVCILMAEGKIPERLKAVANTDDGFELAEIDLAERGSGDLLGEKQSGVIQHFSFLDVSDQEVLVGLRDEVYRFAEKADVHELRQIAYIIDENVTD